MVSSSVDSCRYRSRWEGSSTFSWIQSVLNKKTHSGFLDQNIESSYTTSITSRHSVHFVHNQTSFLPNSNPHDGSRLDWWAISPIRGWDTYFNSTSSEETIKTCIVDISGILQYISLWEHVKEIQKLTSINFLLRTSLALSSIGL